MMKDKLVLIVEDDPRIARLLELSLKAEGFKVNRAGTGNAGRMMLQSNSPDLVLLDLGLAFWKRGQDAEGSHDIPAAKAQ